MILETFESQFGSWLVNGFEDERQGERQAERDTSDPA